MYDNIWLSIFRVCSKDILARTRVGMHVSIRSALSTAHHCFLNLRQNLCSLSQKFGSPWSIVDMIIQTTHCKSITDSNPSTPLRPLHHWNDGKRVIAVAAEEEAFTKDSFEQIREWRIQRRRKQIPGGASQRSSRIGVYCEWHISREWVTCYCHFSFRFTGTLRYSLRSYSDSLNTWRTSHGPTWSTRKLSFSDHNVRHKVVLWTGKQLFRLQPNRFNFLTCWLYNSGEKCRSQCQWDRSESSRGNQRWSMVRNV